MVDKITSTILQADVYSITQIIGVFGRALSGQKLSAAEAAEAKSQLEALFYTDFDSGGLRYDLVVDSTITTPSDKQASLLMPIILAEVT